MSKYSLDKNIFTNYFKEDGLQENVFIYNSITKLKNGYLAFGGVNGVSILKPNVFDKNNRSPKVFITGFSIFNKRTDNGITENGRVIFNDPISEVKEINLSFRDKLFSLDYSTLEYKSPKQTYYQYKINEIHEDWIDLGTKNSLPFHNLPAGNYTLHIRVKIPNSNIEGEPRILKINIKPPFYATNLFIFLSVFFTLTFGIFIYYQKTLNASKKFYNVW